MPPRLNIIVYGVILSFQLFIIADAVSSDKKFFNSISRFTNPQLVKIYGLPEGAEKTCISTEEPFISRDGRFLFFNTGKNENNKDLHYAECVNNKWIYRDSMKPNINDSKEVQATPTMDKNYNFLYLDTAINSMIRIAKFSPNNGKLHSLRDVDGIPTKKVEFMNQKFIGNMGVEISSDGRYMFFSQATWKLKMSINGFTIGKLLSSNILFSRKKGNKYIYNKAETKHIMMHINTQNLEYAASISSDGLELFFTRFLLSDYNTGKIRSRIMHSTRTTLSSPFSEPEMIETIGSSDFVEGSAISADGKELYYHKLVGKKFRIYKVTR